MKLSGKVTSKVTRTETASWCKRAFMPMSARFREGRKWLRDTMTACFWCGHKFEDGEMMALACFGNKGNKVLCQSCADDLIGDGEEGDGRA